MVRTWGFQTVSGNAQPLFGDVLSAAFSGQAASKSGLYAVSVAAVLFGTSPKYMQGDRIVLGFGGSTPTNILLVQTVDTVHNILYCKSEGDAPVAAWAINTQIALSISCAQIAINSKLSNAGNIEIGNDSTVTNTGGGSAFAEATPGGSYSYGIAQFNALLTTELWFAGTANDAAGVAAIII